MCKVAANAYTFFMRLKRGAIAAGKLIAKANSLVHVIADGLNARPTKSYLVKIHPVGRSILF